MAQNKKQAYYKLRETKIIIISWCEINAWLFLFQMASSNWQLTTQRIFSTLGQKKEPSRYILRKEVLPLIEENLFQKHLFLFFTLALMSFFNVQCKQFINLCSLRFLILAQMEKAWLMLHVSHRIKSHRKLHPVPGWCIQYLNHDFRSLFCRKIKTTYAPSISRSCALSSIQNKLGILALRYCDLNWISTLHFHVLL